MDGEIGHWSFIIGVVLAVFAGFLPQLQTLTVSWVLVVLGVIVGILNITAKETQEFLIASIALVIGASSASATLPLGLVLMSIMGNIVAFVFPAALIVALKAIWALAQD